MYVLFLDHKEELNSLLRDVECVDARVAPKKIENTLTKIKMIEFKNIIEKDLLTHLILEDLIPLNRRMK